MKNRSRILSIAATALIGFAGVIFTACNSLNSDPDSVEIATPDPIPVYAANNPVVIDLLSRVVNAASVSITTKPKLGALARIDNGLYQYTPPVVTAKTEDAIVYAAMDNLGNVIASKRITINLLADSVDLPCALYANPDFATINPASVNNSVTIRILANDFLCGLNDSTDLTVSTYRAPIYGSISYSPNWAESFASYTSQFQNDATDTVIYKLQSVSDPSNVTYGLIVINLSTACILKLYPDSYQISYDSLNGGVARLLVFVNDEVCDADSFSIALDPSHGSATMVDSLGGNTRYVQYVPTTVPHNTIVYDSLHYRACKGSACQETTVLIRNYRH